MQLCMGCCDVAHLHSINLYYESIVSSLQTASCLSVPCVPVHSLKPFWNEELERLKADSVFWHDMLADLKQGHYNRYACPVRLNINWV